MITLSENNIILNELFVKYKELASQVGLVNEDGRFFYDEDKSDELKIIAQDSEAGDQARAHLHEVYKKELVIYKQMEEIRNEIDRRKEKEA